MRKGKETKRKGTSWRQDKERTKGKDATLKARRKKTGDKTR